MNVETKLSNQKKKFICKYSNLPLHTSNVKVSHTLVIKKKEREKKWPIKMNNKKEFKK